MSSPIKILKEPGSLLDDLNSIADFVIGNQSPEECSFTSRDTLPEVISYVTIYPDNKSAVKEALRFTDKLSKMINDMHNKLVILDTKNNLKNKK